jgi:hypothetical protein
MDSFEWQLDNWMRWCRKRDWLPLGPASQVALMMKNAQRMPVSTDTRIMIVEAAALEFNRLVGLLPRRHQTVFLLNHLDKGIQGNMIVYTRHAGTKYKLAGVSRSTFYERAKEADNMVKRWMQ